MSLLSFHFVLLAQHHFTLAALLIPPPPADNTGVNAAEVAIARRLAAVFGGAIMLYLVYHGFAYLGSSDIDRGVHSKRMFQVLLVSAILVLGAITIAPQFVIAILTGQ